MRDSLAAPRAASLATDREAAPWYAVGTRQQRLLVGRVLILVVFLSLWQFGAPIAGIPSFLLPSPTTIWTQLVRGLTAPPGAPESFFFHAGVTFSQGLIGLAIGGAIGLGLGTFLAYMPWAERVILPYIMGFQSLPKVAVAPLIIIWFGLGMESKIVLVALLAFFPLLINSLLGFKSVDSDRLELFASMKASSWQTFKMVSFQSALPAIFAGFEMAVLFALTGSIVGEFLAGQAGLGVLIQRYKNAFNLGGVFAVLIILAVSGVLITFLTRAIRKRLLFWSSSQRLDTNI